MTNDLEGLRTFVSRSSDATELLGEEIGRALDVPALIALDGDLGAGKTCFVRGLARGLGVRDTISSPTYALLQSYAGRLDLHHLDAWMEGRERAFLSDGGLEWVGASGVTVIEWADRVADVLPSPLLSVRIEVTGLDERRIEVGVRSRGRSQDSITAALRALVASLHSQAGLELVDAARPDPLESRRAQED